MPICSCFCPSIRPHFQRAHCGSLVSASRSSWFSDTIAEQLCAVSRELLPLDSGHFPPPFFFLPLFFSPPGSFKQHSPGSAQRVDPGWPCLGTHQVLQHDQDGHQYPPVVSSAGVFSDSSKPLCRTSPAHHLTGAAALPSDISD